MVGEVYAGLSSFKAMFDIAKGLKDINDTTVRNGAVIELQEKILAARDAQATLLERVSQLEKEMARFETWNTEKERYQLTDFGGGTYAHSLKPEKANGEPPHKICTSCYDRGHKSVLQNTGGKHQGRDRFYCPNCKSDFYLGHFVPQPRPQRASTSRYLDR